MAAFHVGPETEQGADLTAHEVELAGSISPTEMARSTDRGIRIVHAGENSGRVARALSSVGGGNDYGANKGNLVTYHRSTRAQTVDHDELGRG